MREYRWINDVFDLSERVIRDNIATCKKLHGWNCKILKLQRQSSKGR
jgi:hypothetical protein